jgi:predicted AlkP superfamily pyrophosphatase or phosphodiesterase
MDLITGTWGNKHNVWDNAVAAPNYNYQNIFRLFKNQYPHKKTAIFSTWQDNRTKLIGEGKADAGTFHFDYKFDGYELDTISFPHDGDSKYIQQIDELVVSRSADGIRNYAPDLSWIYLQYTDDMGHRYGDSDRFYEAIKNTDEQIGRIWEAIQYREKNFKEDWLIVITTDHGRDQNVSALPGS